MSSAELPVRPGFNLECTFREHASVIRFVCCNAQGTTFFSCDDKTLRAWRPSTGSGQSKCKTLNELAFPSYQASFVTAMMCTPEPLNALFVACLDGHLRIYSEKLRLRSCMPWANGQVRQLVFNARRDQIITAGSSGLKAWYCELDYEACRADVAMDLHSIPRTKDGEVVPWGFGKYQHARLQISFNVPGARCINPRTYQQKADGSPLPKDVIPGTQSANIGSSEWCERIVLHEDSQTLFALFLGSVFGYDAGTGAMTMDFSNLHPSQTITSMVYAPESDTMFTATLDQAITVWRVSGNVPQKFRHLGKLVFLMVGDDPNQPRTILTSSYDGLVTLWSADSLEPVHRMRLAQVPQSILRIGPDRVVAHLQNEVKVFTIQHLYDLLLECNSAPLALHKINAGLVQAEFADCSVRLLDVGSGRTDKTVAVTVPQLSTKNLCCSACSLTRRRLYALLSDGALHVWQIQPVPGAAPTFLSAWTHLQREQCISMTLLEAGSLAIPKSLPLTEYGTVAKGAFIPPNAEALEQRVCAVISHLVLGLDNNAGCVSEHLVLGSLHGDVLVVDADRGGNVVCRFPGFKHQGGITHIALSCSGPALRRPWEDSHPQDNMPLPSPCRPSTADWQRNVEDPILSIVVVSRNFLKVWDLELGLRFVHAAETSHAITCLEVCGSRAFLGTITGSVHILDLYTGRPLASSSSLDHMDSVTALSPCRQLQHVVTASRDCHIKVFNFKKALKRSMYVGCPVSAVAFLNLAGDVLMAISKRLVVVKAHKYAFTLHESENGHIQRKESIFEDVPMLEKLQQEVPPRWQDYHMVFVPPPTLDFNPTIRPSSTIGSERARSARRSSSSFGGARTPRASNSSHVLEEHAGHKAAGSRRVSMVGGEAEEEAAEPLTWQDDPLWFIRSKGKKGGAAEGFEAQQRAAREKKHKALQEISRRHPYLQRELVPHQSLPGAPPMANIRTASRMVRPFMTLRSREPSMTGIPEDQPLQQWQVQAQKQQQQKQQQQQQQDQRQPRVSIDLQRVTPPSGIPRTHPRSPVLGEVSLPREPPLLLQPGRVGGHAGAGGGRQAQHESKEEAPQKMHLLPPGLPRPPMPPNLGPKGEPGSAHAPGSKLTKSTNTQGTAAATPAAAAAAAGVAVGSQSDSRGADAVKGGQEAQQATAQRALQQSRSVVRFSTGLQQRLASPEADAAAAETQGRDPVGQGALQSIMRSSGSGVPRDGQQSGMAMRTSVGGTRQLRESMQGSKQAGAASLLPKGQLRGGAGRKDGGVFRGISGPGPLYRESSYSTVPRESSGRDGQVSAAEQSEAVRGSDSGSDWSSGSSSSSDDDGDEEKAALKALRRQQLAYLAQHWQHNELVKHQTYFHVDLMAEELARRSCQRAPADPYGPTTISTSPSASPPRHSSPSLSGAPAGTLARASGQAARAGDKAACRDEGLGVPLPPSPLFTGPLNYPGTRPHAKHVDGGRGLAAVGGDSMESRAMTIVSQGLGGGPGASRATSAGGDPHAPHAARYASDATGISAPARGGGAGAGGSLACGAGVSLELGGLPWEGSSSMPPSMGVWPGRGKAWEAQKHADLKGLAAEFRRALPLLCSQTAFMEGLQTVEEEELIAALRGEFDNTGTKKKRRRKGKRRRRRRKGDDGPADAAPGEEASTPSDPVFGGWNKTPPLMAPSAPGTTVKAAGGGSSSKKVSGERRNGRKKGRRGKGGKPSLKVLRAVDMAAYLAKVARDDYVIGELLQFERHGMLTSTGRHVQVQPLSAPLRRGGLLQPLPRLPNIHAHNEEEEQQEQDGNPRKAGLSRNVSQAWEKPPSLEKVLSQMPSTKNKGTHQARRLSGGSIAQEASTALSRSASKGRRESGLSVRISLGSVQPLSTVRERASDDSQGDLAKYLERLEQMGGSR